MSERPEHQRLRRLADWINPTGAKKIHSLMDKVYKRKNLQLAWGKVAANGGSGGIDGQTLEEFEAHSEQYLDRLHRELKEDTYRPEPVRQVAIPKAGKPGEFRPARHSDDLRSGMSTSVAQSVGIDLRTGIR